MHRTKERVDFDQPDNRFGISGCRVFDGEDLGKFHIDFGDRTKMQKIQQKEWVEQQKREKEQKIFLDKQEEDAYAKQTLEINRMRGMLEDEMNDKRRKMMKSIQEQNFQLAKEKKDSEKKKKLNDLDMEYKEIKFSMHEYPTQINPGDTFPVEGSPAKEFVLQKK